MGQYYKVVNITKKEYLSPWELGDGSKLLEMGLSAGGTLYALTLLLAHGNGRGGGDFYTNDHKSADQWIGRWAGDKIVITGDYADEGDFLKECIKEKDIPELTAKAMQNNMSVTLSHNLYSFAGEYFINISKNMVKDINSIPRLHPDEKLRTNDY